LIRKEALALIGGGVALASAAQPARAQTLTPLRIGSVAADSYAEPYYAQDLGYYTQAGLSVELSSFNNGAALAAAVIGGSIDAGVGDATEIANGVTHGVPFVIIAGSGLYDTKAPTTLLCAAASAPIATAKDLEGQVIAVISLVSLQSNALKKWLTNGGADLSKVKLVEMPFPSMGPALIRGTIAAAMLSEPLITAFGTSIKTLGKVYDAIAPHFLISQWFTTRDWLSKNPDVAKRIVRIAYDTARWANAHPDLSAPILAKYSKIDLDRIRAMKRATYATSLDPHYIQPILDTDIQFKALERPVKASELIARV
jgi:NitT/TauT family transport system substrate-binding protein